MTSINPSSLRSITSHHQTLFGNLSLCILAGAMLLASGCNTADPLVIRSQDRKVQLTVPGTWSHQPDLHNTAGIQVGHPWSECYVLVFSEEKKDLEVPTLDWHSQFTHSKLLQNLTDGLVERGPKKLEINGFPAVQYEITGTTETISLAYLHTTVETNSHLHQIVAWTLMNRMEKNRAQLEAVTSSFAMTRTEVVVER